jgi:hypothetical protein
MDLASKKDTSDKKPVTSAVPNVMGYDNPDSKGDIKPGPFRAAERLVRRCEGMLVNTVLKILPYSLREFVCLHT